MNGRTIILNSLQSATRSFLVASMTPVPANRLHCSDLKEDVKVKVKTYTMYCDYGHYQDVARQQIYLDCYYEQPE